MNKEHLISVAEDIEYLRTEWQDDVPRSTIRRGSAVLRRLLVEREIVVSSVIALGLLYFGRPTYAFYTLLATCLWLVIALVLISKDEANERRRKNESPSPQPKDSGQI